MTNRYAVFNTQDGTYTKYDTEQEALENFWINLLAFAYPYFHNTPYSIIKVLEDGSEEWQNAKQEIIQNPMLEKEKMDQLIDKVTRILNGD